MISKPRIGPSCLPMRILRQPKRKSKVVLTPDSCDAAVADASADMNDACRLNRMLGVNADRPRPKTAGSISLMNTRILLTKRGQPHPVD
jgi:hypothetical protein